MALLTTLPLWLSGVLLVGGATLIAMAAPAFVRRHVSSDRLRINNEVAGFTFATVGVLYAVLLAFAVIIVWEKFSEAEHSVAQEAGAAATLYRLAEGIGGIPASPSATG
jgi:Na+/proline symporter